jgi:tetratricopeptide (TPR) repeat protein
MQGRASRKPALSEAEGSGRTGRPALHLRFPDSVVREIHKAMKTTKRLLVVFAAALVLLCSTGCAKLKARDHLNKGVQAFKNSKFEQAIDHFQQAVVLDPTLINARLYLATALAQQYIPGVDAPDNNRFGEQAIDQYKQVLQVDPRNINSIKGIAYLYLQMKKFPLAKEYYKKASELDPNDPEPYYSVAVIDWTQTYVPRQEERAKLGMKPDESLPAKDKKVCATLKEQNTANVQEGIDNLNKALHLRPDYDDAMAYLNLLERQKADQVDSAEDRANFLADADALIEKVKEIKQKKQEKAAPQG